MKKLLDTSHPWFRPLWVRVLLVALCFGWAILEFATTNPFWGVIFLALGAYVAYAFFIDPDRER